MRADTGRKPSSVSLPPLLLTIILATRVTEPQKYLINHPLYPAPKPKEHRTSPNNTVNTKPEARAKHTITNKNPSQIGKSISPIWKSKHKPIQRPAQRSESQPPKSPGPWHGAEFQTVTHAHLSLGFGVRDRRRKKRKKKK
ncbi:hypothetical protein K402DRAFT_114270 [Aulographum hederae CBS 113979]|uniref:Secreted protein n=1 Tax=Aulographum hederae CBS 113979 TaxID=1176131 RepID=A0A6G1GWX0_9PEZI|nr:hypothetical protein K402DRAFT_114270 [Aulographum hederae CBS 113979]